MSLTPIASFRIGWRIRLHSGLGYVDTCSFNDLVEFRLFRRYVRGVTRPAQAPTSRRVVGARCLRQKRYAVGTDPIAPVRPTDDRYTPSIL
jgi:hypothetical protein